MPHRAVLTDRQRFALFDLPTDEVSLRRHYTLADDDLEFIGRRRTLKTVSASPSAFRPFIPLKAQTGCWKLCKARITTRRVIRPSHQFPQPLLVAA